MPLTPEDIEKIRHHLSQFPEAQHCPVCRTNRWEVSGPFSIIADENGNLVLGGPAMPVVVLTCGRCFYARHFAWLPIKRAVVPKPPPLVVVGTGAPAKPSYWEPPKG